MVNSDKSIDELINHILDWMSWFPTFSDIPADLRENSVPAGDINPNGYWMPKSLRLRDKAMG